MADLSKFWRNQQAAWSAEYDQKTMMAREIIAENFAEEGDDLKLREIINHFSRDERVAICLMGILAQVGLCALAMDDCGEDRSEEI